MKTISVEEFEKSFDETLDKVSNGEEIFIEHDGKYFAITKVEGEKHLENIAR